MYRPFGQIPSPNPYASSNIADAARHIEDLLHDEPNLDIFPNSDQFPSPGVDIPSARESEEVVEEIDPMSSPEPESQEDESHDGAAGGVVEGGIEYLAFYCPTSACMRQIGVLD